MLRKIVKSEFFGRYDVWENVTSTSRNSFIPIAGSIAMTNGFSDQFKSWLARYGAFRFVEQLRPVPGPRTFNVSIFGFRQWLAVVFDFFGQM